MSGEGKIVKALSIRQPWAWLIVNGFKDIENRQWRTGYRGRLLIHAAQGMTRGEYADCLEFIDGVENVSVHLPDAAKLQRGGIVGVAEMVDCVNRSESPWFAGPYGFVLKGAEELPFWPCKGQLGFFEPKTT